MRIIWLLFLAVPVVLAPNRSIAACLSCANAAPDETTIGSSISYETQFLGGLQWNFGDNSPELVLGFRQTRTTMSDDVVGGKLDFGFPLNARFLDGFTIRGMGLAGNRDVQGEFGAGFQSFNFRPLLAGGVQGPYVNGGANYVMGSGLQPYIEGNSLGQPRRPKQSIRLSCPPTKALRPVSTLGPVPPPPSAIVDDKTCVFTAP